MTINRRHEEILKILSRLRSVSVTELTRRLAVSEVTIRKDLSTLEEMGQLLRSRGGADLAEDKSIRQPLTIRRREHLEQKKTIVKRAATFIREGDTIFLDSGSTCTLLAKELCGMNLRVVTNSLDVLTVLADCQGLSVISVGGNYRMEAGSFIGPMAEDNLKNFQVETAFLGATAFSGEGLFSAQNIIESRIKSMALQVARRGIVLADSSKYGISAFSVFARPEDVDVLITDSTFEEVSVFQNLGIEVLFGIHTQ
ncbi:MAG: DeoR/GlpR family DNA-binding transcription regulator [Spirochaetaceae bacterium]